MPILKYTEEVQKQIKSKTIPAPWLHFGLNDLDDWAIFVWDTREVLETGNSNGKFVTGLRANDNLEPLIGDTKFDVQEKYVTSAMPLISKSTFATYARRESHKVNELCKKEMQRFIYAMDKKFGPGNHKFNVRM